MPGLRTPHKRPADRNQGKYKGFSFTLIRIKKKLFLCHEKNHLLPFIYPRL